MKRASFNFLKNKFNAIVGMTGSGKSTIVNIIMKFYDFASGTVLVGDHDIRTIDALWLRERIGFVGQEPIIFSGTIRENIVVGKENATEEEIWEVLAKVNLRDFVNSLP